MIKTTREENARYTVRSSATYISVSHKYDIQWQNPRVATVTVTQRSIKTKNQIVRLY